MRVHTRTLASFGLIASMAFSIVSAQETAKSDAKQKKAPDGTKNRVFHIPKEITLTSEQQEKLDAIKKEKAPKVAELTTKIDGVLTSEQKAARKDAAAKAKSDGLKGKKATASIEQTLKLTDDQKKQRTELQSEMATLRTSIKTQIHAFLNDDQKAYYKLGKAKKSSSATESPTTAKSPTST